MRKAALAGAALMAVAAVAAPGQAMAASETCAAPTATAVDGYEFNDYFRLVSQRNPDDPKTTWICYRAFSSRASAQTGGIDRGGRIDVTDATVSPTLPSADNQGAACTTTAGNFFPGPRPLAAGHVGGDPGDPNYTPFLIDAYFGGTDLWGCLQAGSLSARVKASTSGIRLPVVTHAADAPGTPLPVQKQGPFGFPSNKCLESNGHVRVLNMRIHDTHIWLYHWPESATKTAICVRVQRPGDGLQPIGYRVVLDTDTSGVAPVIEYSDVDTTPCTETIAALTSPVQVRLSQSSGVSPASVCLEAQGLKRRITVGTNGAPRAPLPAIHKDPDSL